MLAPASNNLHRCRQSVCREQQHATGADTMAEPDSDLSDDDVPVLAAAAPAIQVRPVRQTGSLHRSDRH
jgi:hypothetical protein